MSTLKMNEVIGKDKTFLMVFISDLKRELLNLRFQKAAGELGNTARFREVRVGISRAYTELSKIKNNQTRG